jgi:uncharacterized surface protein with fasciclin (FAS1) repeats
VAILTCHIVPGSVLSRDLIGQKILKSLGGGELYVDARNDVRIDGAKVVQADIPASNGIVHVIDAVILPKI